MFGTSDEITPARRHAHVLIDTISGCNTIENQVGRVSSGNHSSEVFKFFPGLHVPGHEAIAPGRIAVEEVEPRACLDRITGLSGWNGLQGSGPGIERSSGRCGTSAMVALRF